MTNNNTFSEADEQIPARQPPARRGPSLARTTTQGAKLPDRIVIYAPPGWGKTTWAAYLPKPIFLMTPGEDRLIKLIEAGLVPPTAYFEDIARTWSDVLLAINELTIQPHDYRTFVMDTGNGVERLGHEQVCDTEFNGDWGEGGFNSFARGEKISANRLWVPFLGLLDRLREKTQMRIVLCCHAGVRPTKNPDGPDYDKIEPALTRLAWSATSRWCDMILCGAFEVATAKDDPRNKIQKAKGKGGKVRLLHTSPTAAYEAKNCHRLPPTVRLGDDPQQAFAAFRAAFPVKPRAEPAHEQTPGGNGSTSPGRAEHVPGHDPMAAHAMSDEDAEAERAAIINEPRVT